MAGNLYLRSQLKQVGPATRTRILSHQGMQRLFLEMQNARGVDFSVASPRNTNCLILPLKAAMVPSSMAITRASQNKLMDDFDCYASFINFQNPLFGRSMYNAADARFERFISVASALVCSNHNSYSSGFPLVAILTPFVERVVQFLDNISRVYRPIEELAHLW